MNRARNKARVFAGGDSAGGQSHAILGPVLCHRGHLSFGVNHASIRAFDRYRERAGESRCFSIERRVVRCVWSDRDSPITVIGCADPRALDDSDLKTRGEGRPTDGLRGVERD
jgi:hypothetical protein